MTRRYVLTGRKGQVAQALIQRAASHADIEIIPLNRPEFDLSDIATIEPALIATLPDLIISAAAYTAVDQAETEEERVFSINATAVGEIGRVAAKLGIPVVHLSTDYVFDGEKTSAYQEVDPVSPLGVYGRSKLEGERLLIASGADHAILRTAWVYSPFGKNFLRTMLRLAENRNEINVVADQIGNPTCALDIADAVMKVAGNILADPDRSLRGVFHMTGSGEASWADFAKEILRLSKEIGGPSTVVHSITTSEYPTPARRPKNSRLNCRKLADAHGVHMPDWKTSTSDVVRTLLTI